MTIRTFLPGDEVAQVGIYNEAAGDLPKFKVATIDEVRRRLRGPDFDAGARFYALVNDRPVAYATFQANGRVNYPWCRKGHENQAEPLFEQVLQAMKARGVRRAFAAYRADWQPQREFFEKRGFPQVREMVNYVVDLADLPIPAARPSSAITPLAITDIPGLPALGPKVFRVHEAMELGQDYLNNPYFPAEACFVLRSRADNSPVGMGLVIADASYANPKQLDAQMPCFRLGAIGTEELTAKRINGLFSFVVPDTRDVSPVALDLLSHAAQRVDETDIETFAAQAPSDAPHLIRFYKQYFRRQGSFPIFEREL